MEKQQIAARIKEIISQVASIEPDQIGDDESFEEMGLDSLSLLEVGVDIDYEFRLGIPDEELRSVVSVNNTADLVLRYMAQKQAEVA